MRVQLPDGIKAIKGHKYGMVFYGNKNAEGWCYARAYVYPNITEHHKDFGLKTSAVCQTWKDAAAGFKNDLQTFTEAWNERQHSKNVPKADLNAWNLFIKACFAAAKTASFDLSKLTVNNFGGKSGDLLGATAPKAGNLIIAAGLPDCGLDMETLNNPIVAA